MRTCDQEPFCLAEIPTPFDGLKARKIRFTSAFLPDRCTPPGPCVRKEGRPKPRAAIGRAVVLDPGQFDLCIYPFYELIHRTWLPGTRDFVRFGPNLGTSLYEFIYNRGGPELRKATELGVKRLEQAERAERIGKDLGRCIFACNSLQTNFVRGNGFVIAPPDPDPGARKREAELICRPCGAPGMYDDHYEALGPKPVASKDGSATGFDGKYDVIILECEQRQPVVGSFLVEDGKWQDQKLPMPDLAICSPRILKCGVPVAACEIPYCDNKERQTIGNEVNWDPAATCTSFTAFGVSARGEIIVASMFEGAHLGDTARNRGILATEMGCLMLQLGATDAVIGGGAADTQQFLDADCGDMPPLMLAPPRAKRPEEAATREVEGPRGLGAIFAVLQK